MARVTGPLHSNTASGQLAKTLIFQTYRGRSYAKKYAVPGNTPGFDKPNQSPAQLAVQALTKSLMQHWPEISTEDQATWDALAIPQRIERVNAYLKYNYARNAVGLDPTDVYPPGPEYLPPLKVVTGEPTPDVTGTWGYDGEFTSHGITASSWKKIIGGSTFYLWCGDGAGQQRWFVSDVKGCFTGILFAGYWDGGANPNGEFFAGAGDCSGSLIVGD